MYFDLESITWPSHIILSFSVREEDLYTRITQNKEVRALETEKQSNLSIGCDLKKIKIDHLFNNMGISSSSITNVKTDLTGTGESFILDDLWLNPIFFQRACHDYFLPKFRAFRPVWETKRNFLFLFRINIDDWHMWKKTFMAFRSEKRIYTLE